MGDVSPDARPAPVGVEAMPGLYAQLLDAWSKDSSASPDRWLPSRPSLGQCAVTALIVQERFGGELVRVVNAGDSHYFNRLPDGSEVDLTRDQFDSWQPSEAQVRSREYVLSHQATADRFQLLLAQL